MREYIDLSAQKRLIAAMLDDPKITKRDLKIALYLSDKDAQRKDLLAEFFGSNHDPSGSSNRANLTRSLQHLRPYLDITDDDVTGTWYRLKSGL